MADLNNSRKGAVMPTDVNPQIDEIKNELKDSARKGWIGRSSVHRGIMQPLSTCSSSNGGHPAKRYQLDDIVFDKIVDLSSPILMQTCAIGKIIPKMKLEFMRTDGDSMPIQHVEIELENVLIDPVTPGIEAVSLLPENVCLKLVKVKWRYGQQKIVAGSSGQTLGDWDLSQNKIA
jgi:type VI secretion system secreted protein Hcp